MTTTTSPDDVRTEPPAIDHAAHKRQFDRFVHLIKWFIIHALLILPALYLMLIAGQGVAGTVFLLLGFGALAYGIITTPSAGRNVKPALESTGRPGERTESRRAKPLRPRTKT